MKAQVRIVDELWLGPLTGADAIAALDVTVDCCIVSANSAERDVESERVAEISNNLLVS